MSFKDKMMEKLAKQSFNSPQFKHSWDSHMQVFAPVLEHAFEENYIAKIHLCAALNSLGTNQSSQCLFQLQQLDFSKFLLCHATLLPLSVFLILPFRHKLRLAFSQQ